MFNSDSFIIKEMRPRRRKTFLTVIVTGFLSAVFLFAFLAFGNDEIKETTLTQVLILFRHGERTPSFKYPTDPHFNYNWVDGLGALTNKGKQTMYHLGKNLRKRYKTFLNEYYTPEEVLVTSSYAPRCQMSAMTLLAGLYPPVDEQVWNKHLLWQPIPVNPIPRSIDNMIAAKALCNTYNVEKMMSDKELHSNLTENEYKTFKYLSENTNLVVKNIEQVEQIYSTLKIENENGLSIPNWAKLVFPEPMKTLTAMNLASYTRTPILKRLQGGPLLKEWLENIKSNNKKIYLYAGHDLTIVNLLRTIGFMNVELPPDYGASFIIEVHLMSGQKTLKALYYKSSSDAEPVDLDIPQCESICSVELFNRLMQQVIPSNWSEECKKLI